MSSLCHFVLWEVHLLTGLYYLQDPSPENVGGCKQPPTCSSQPRAEESWLVSQCIIGKVMEEPRIPTLVVDIFTVAVYEWNSMDNHPIETSISSLCHFVLWGLQCLLGLPSFPKIPARMLVGASSLGPFVLSLEKRGVGWYLPPASMHYGRSHRGA